MGACRRLAASGTAWQARRKLAVACRKLPVAGTWPACRRLAAAYRKPAAAHRKLAAPDIAGVGTAMRIPAPVPLQRVPQEMCSLCKWGPGSSQKTPFLRVRHSRLRVEAS